MYRPVSTEHVLERILRIFCVRGTRAEQAPLLQKSLRTMRIADVSISTDCRADQCPRGPCRLVKGFGLCSVNVIQADTTVLYNYLRFNSTDHRNTSPLSRGPTSLSHRVTTKLPCSYNYPWQCANITVAWDQQPMNNIQCWSKSSYPQLNCSVYESPCLLHSPMIIKIS